MGVYILEHFHERVYAWKSVAVDSKNLDGGVHGVNNNLLSKHGRYEECIHNSWKLNCALHIR